MKKNKFPQISDLDLDDNKFIIFFDGGDLGIRKNVDNLKDFYKCEKLFEDAFYEYSTDYNEFYWSIRYTIPDGKQFEKLLKTGKYEKNYPFEYNNHWYTPLHYSFKTKTLYVEPFFFLNGDPDLISYLADYCKSIKKIKISMIITLEGELAERFSKDKILDTPVIEDYLRGFLKHKNFWCHFLTLNKNQLNGLIKLKKSLKSRKIKIAFPDASKEVKVILKKKDLI